MLNILLQTFCFSYHTPLKTRQSNQANRVKIFASIHHFDTSDVKYRSQSFRAFNLIKSGLVLTLYKCFYFLFVWLFYEG